ncbi:MAG: FAD-dependent oxidoreductase [Deltaproteobacteria bacterium]|jgi:2,4-dienoyl-CoA reductase-like NADH-dependent reductase (Old Yellow Enzyme family)/thioredoxin reductase|nr:FAD-dependent oxidoreductase [Deltaproteobacteria bacterium]
MQPDPKLSDPLNIKGRRFKNRTVLAPLVPNCAGRDGAVTDAYKQFYQARAQVGFMILGAAYVHPLGRGFQRQLGIHDDNLIAGLTELTQSLRRFTQVGVQLSFKSVGRLPETFGIREIATITEAFTHAARRASKCGFSAVELHACHDYWLNFFLSPHFNHRTDKYGSSSANRFRLLKEVVQAIRAEIGAELILGVRLSVAEFVQDGLTVDDSLDIARRLENLGVDYISASGGIGLTQYRMSPPMEVERGSLLHLSQTLKKTLSIPVIGVGRLDRPGVFSQAIGGGYADMAATARALIADPEYAVKTIENQTKEIRPCVACNFCLLCLHRNEPVRCAVNPFLGRDLLRLPPLQNRTNVMVVGGGAAGLSAAATAAGRGARVKLLEQKQDLGGVINLGMRPPFKEPLKDLVDYLVYQAINNGVHIQSGVKVTSEAIARQAPDEVIIATGAASLQPKIEGIQTHDRVMTALDALALQHKPPGRYLIVGGGAGGLEVAEYLATDDVDITIIEMTETIGSGLHATRQQLMLERIEKAGVRLLKNTRLVAIAGKDVKVAAADGVNTLGPFDVIVFAVGYQSNAKLATEINQDQAVTIVGDAVQPRSIYEAIKEGFDAAISL